MSKRTNSIVTVIISKHATVYVEADTPQEAAEIAKNNRDDQFVGSESVVNYYESYPTKRCKREFWIIKSKAYELRKM